MSLEKNLGLITLSIVALSVAATATYSFSAKGTLAGQKDAQKTRGAEKVSAEGGLREVLSDDDPRKPDWPLVDVIAVHGLGSKYPASWTKDDTMWLKDLLPDDFPQARILAFVYPSGAFDDPDFVDLRALGGSLLRSIARDRANLRARRKRPLIFIGHSFGGLVIKKALALSQVSNPYVEGDHSYIAEATCGILFLGTPHFGSQYAGLLWTRLSGIFGGTHSGLVRALKLLAPDLEYLNQDFLAIPAIRKLPQQNLICFYETKDQLFGPVVEEWSACLSIATRVSLNAHHDDMNKFSDREGPYDDLKYCLQRIYDSLMDAETSNKNDFIFAVKMNTPGYDLLNFHPTDTWSEQDKKGRISLSMGGSGTSGCLMFQSKTGDERFAVTFGVHNWEPWEDIATNFGEETAQEIRDSYYGGKRSVWSACDGVRRKFRPLGGGKFLYLTFDEVVGRRRYPAEVMVK